MKNNELVKELIYAKGLTISQASRKIKVGYHSLAKTLTPSPWLTKSGEIRFRECRHIRKALAEWLNCPYDLMWGEGSEFLKRLIREEIDRQCELKCELEKSRKKQALGL